MSHVFLVGFMGAGKSTVGRIVAKRLGRPFMDLDAEIARRSGRTVAEIFASEGEEGFRVAEAEALASIADEPPSVVACGGGVVLVTENRHRLKEMGHAVYLRVSAEEAIARIGDTSGRPLLEREDATAMASQLLKARETLYRAISDIVVDTTGRTPDEVAEEVVAQVREASGGGETS